MPSDNSELLLCYNRGCGSRFNPADNKEGACQFHPGNPVFHDAYKSWSCCKKRSTDFTEFLNIKGCTISCHSNVKPPEPEKPKIDPSKASEVIVYEAPVPKVSTLKRPPFDTELIKMVPEKSIQLKTEIENIVQQKNHSSHSDIAVGTTCKNKGCKVAYEGKESNDTTCVFHPGVPVFHEGLKFWSCCKKKTTDFAAFLEQVGCDKGDHVWVEKNTSSTQTNCRYDWHQTGGFVVMSIYAKKYDPDKSSVELNPIRAKVNLLFPENSSSFSLDLELFGVVDVEKSQVEMLRTKVEIKLKKAEPGSWTKLELPRISQPSAPDQTST